jgi:hypothetical protein
MSTNDVLCPDLRSFFLVPGDGWTEAVLSFMLTSPAASGTPDYFRAPGGVTEPAIAKAAPVYDNAGKRLGEVEGFEIDPALGSDHSRHHPPWRPLSHGNTYTGRLDRVRRRSDHPECQRQRS